MNLLSMSQCQLNVFMWIEIRLKKLSTSVKKILNWDKGKNKSQTFKRLGRQKKIYFNSVSFCY